MNGTLEECLSHIALTYGLSASELIAYAYEDNLGGHFPTLDNPSKYKKGIWGVEGQALYALVRALHPKNVLEIGNCWGTSTAHIAKALLTNGVGRLTTIDNGVEPTCLEVEGWYHEIIESVKADLFDWNYKYNPPYDFIFEDAYHEMDMVTHVWKAFYQYGAPGGMIVSHDSEHERTQADVQTGIRNVIGDAFTSYQISPALCGLAMWRKPFAS